MLVSDDYPNCNACWSLNSPLILLFSLVHIARFHINKSLMKILSCNNVKKLCIILVFFFFNFNEDLLFSGLERICSASEKGSLHFFSLHDEDVNKSDESFFADNVEKYFYTPKQSTAKE